MTLAPLFTHWVRRSTDQAKEAKRVALHADRAELQATDPEFYATQLEHHTLWEVSSTRDVTVASVLCALIAVPLLWSDHPRGRWVALAAAVVTAIGARLHMEWVRKNPDEFFLEAREGPDWIEMPYSVAFLTGFGCLVYAVVTRW